MMDNELTNFILLGTVSAGFPSPGDDWREQPLNFHDMMMKHALSTYSVKVDSMVGACLHPGDIVVVDRALLTTTHKKNRGRPAGKQVYPQASVAGASADLFTTRKPEVSAN